MKKSLASKFSIVIGSIFNTDIKNDINLFSTTLISDQALVVVNRTSVR